MYAKLDFFLIYIAPWNMTWGSIVHAVLQPLGLPHTSIFGIQLLWSCLVSAPLYPFVGSSWNNWEVINLCLMINTYSIALNPASSMFNSHTMRSLFIK